MLQVRKTTLGRSFLCGHVSYCFTALLMSCTKSNSLRFMNNFRRGNKKKHRETNHRRVKWTKNHSHVFSIEKRTNVLIRWYEVIVICENAI